MMYDVIVSDLERAKEAIASGKIEERTADIRHALLALEHLQISLNFEQGGDCARNLDRLYSLIRGKLLEAQLKVSADLLDEQIGLLLSVREAWEQVEQMTSAQPMREASSVPPQLLQAETNAHAEWTA